MQIELTKILADLYIFYYKVQSYHWNVTGKDFYMLHDFFGDIYADIAKEIDGIAEQIRVAGGNPPYSLAELYKSKSIIEDESIPESSQKMISNLINDNQIIINRMTDFFRYAESIEVGVSDYVAGLVDSHKKLQWMLKSSHE